MNKKVMITLTVLPWILTVMLSIAVAWGFDHILQQDTMLHGMARAFVNLGTLAMDQDKRMDDFGMEFHEVSLRFDDLEQRVKDLESASKWSPPRYEWNFPTNWYMGTNQFYFYTNGFIYCMK